MKLQRVRVQNYRSIVDSGPVDIEERVTVLIGKNEQGKTTFQKGLASLNEGVAYSPKDLPNHLRATLEQIPADQIPIVHAWFSLDAADRSKLAAVVPHSDTITGIHVVKHYDGHYTYSTVQPDDAEVSLEPRPPDTGKAIEDIKEAAEGLRVKLKTHTERLPSFAPSVEQAASHINDLVGAQLNDHEHIANVVKTFATAMKGVPAQDAAIQEDIAHAISIIVKAQTSIQQAVSRDFYAPLREALPSFIFHSTIMDRVPDFVGIVDFLADPEANSKGMANLCAVAGLSMQKLQQLAGTTDTGDRETFEDHYRSTISGGINEFWTQEHYTVHFRFEPTRLSVSISDGSYDARIAPSERSDGFQWYLSFYAALLCEVSATDSMVLLLDNPGLELHANGQRDIKRFLEEKLPAPAQVIYVTHSPAMIDPYNLEQVRQVELHGDLQGTKVSKLATKGGTDFDLLEPVRSAVGANLASSLILNEFNVLVEGAADKPILEGAALYLRPEDSKRILINGSIAESSGLLPRFYQRAKLPFVAFLDADSAGRTLKGSLQGWGIAEGQIVELSSLFEPRGDDFELEDILSTAFYHSAVVAAYPEQAVEPPDTANPGKQTKYYERKFREQHRIAFSKRRVAEAVKRLLLEGKGDSDTTDSLRKVINGIWEALQRHVSAT